MFTRIKAFFNDGSALTAQDNKESTEKRIQVAACALFIEMARTDDEFSEEEQNRIISILKKEFSLSDDMCKELIELSKLELQASVDLWQFTNLINENYSPADKIRLIEMIWRVVYADGKLDKHEDYLVKKLAMLLNLRHREMIDAKLKVLGRK